MTTTSTTTPAIVDLGASQAEFIFLDAISPDHLFENMVQASVYSIAVGQDHLPGIQPAILDLLFDDNYTTI